MCLDFGKAVDYIQDNLIVHKLNTFGLSNNLLAWIENDDSRARHSCILCCNLLNCKQIITILGNGQNISL